MEFPRNNTHSAHVCRRAYIPNNSKDEVKEILNYLTEDEVEIKDNVGKKHGFFRSDLCSDRIYSIFQSNESINRNQRNLYGKKYYSHEENPKIGQATLKRNIVFDSSLGCCIPLYTRKPGCARMKLDIIDYGKNENFGESIFVESNFNRIPNFTQNVNIKRNFNQHFAGCSTNVIGQVKDEFGHRFNRTGLKSSKVNKSSVHFENDYYMPEEGSSYENFAKVRHGVNRNYNGSRLTFTNGFLTPIS